MNEGTGSGGGVPSAIMSTDAVDFSAALRADEERALSQLREDLDRMRRICEMHDRLAVRNTGDGLLVLFSTVEQAVSAAWEIQRSLGGRAHPEGGERLAHRIGVHRGEVTLTEAGARGPAVDLAARIQAEADPGGVCISQAAYASMRGRLPLEGGTAVPRQPVSQGVGEPVYELLPHGSTAPGRLPHSTPAGGMAAAAPRSRGWLLPAAAIVGVIVVIVAGVAFTLMQDEGPEPALPAGILLRAGRVPTAGRAEDWERVRQRYLSTLDLAGLRRWLSSAEGARIVRDASARSRLSSRYERLDRIVRELRAELARHRAGSPLALVLPLPQGPTEMRVWTDGGTLHLHDGQRDQTAPLSRLPGHVAAQVLVGLTHGRSAGRLSWDDATLLAEEFGLPLPPGGDGFPPAGPPPASPGAFGPRGGQFPGGPSSPDPRGGQFPEGPGSPGPHGGRPPDEHGPGGSGAPGSPPGPGAWPPGGADPHRRR